MVRGGRPLEKGTSSRTNLLAGCCNHCAAKVSELGTPLQRQARVEGHSRAVWPAVSGGSCMPVAPTERALRTPRILSLPSRLRPVDAGAKTCATAFCSVTLDTEVAPAPTESATDIKKNMDRLTSETYLRTSTYLISLIYPRQPINPTTRI